MSNNPHDPIAEIVADQLGRNNPQLFASMRDSGDLQGFIERLALEIGDHCDNLIARGAEPSEAKAHALAELLPEPEEPFEDDHVVESPWVDILGLNEAELQELYERLPWLEGSSPMPSSVATIVLNNLIPEC